MNSDYFYLKGGLKNNFLLFSKQCITSIEALNNYVIFNFINPVNNMADSLTTYMSLKDTEKALEGGNFLRISRTHIISLIFIKMIDGNMVELKDGKKITIGPKYKDRFFMHVRQNMLVKSLK